jgi:nicotinate-nucleotide adenylyltransferase
MDKPLKIGVFGGSFNPPTIAHLALTQHAHEALKLDQIWWLVAPHNPFKDKRTLAPFVDRIAMCEIVARDYLWLVVSDWEARLGTQQTSDTLKGLQAHNPGHRFIWLMGTDNLLHFHTWNNWQDIVQSVPVAVFIRPGDAEKVLTTPAIEHMGSPQSPAKADHLQPGQWTMFANEQMAVSATEVRHAVQNGQPSPFIITDVAHYIASNQLYRS